MCTPERKNLHNWRLRLCKHKYKVSKRLPPWLEAPSVKAVRAQAGAVLQGWGCTGGHQGLPPHRGLVPGASEFRTWGAGASLLGRRRRQGEVCMRPVLRACTARMGMRRTVGVGSV